VTAPILYTIGHSNHEIATFIDLLERHDVKLVADVRSSPYSGYNSQFNREPLSAALRSRGLEYLFLGRELGARRDEPECYVDQKVKFPLVARLPLFRQGIDHLRQTIVGSRTALLCAEKDPLACHRAILICRYLRKDDIDIRHILEDGVAEQNADAESRLLALLKMPSRSLFQSKDELIEEAYDRQGDKIAFVDSPALPSESLEHLL
jgi:uncharacterized protein (DUF488 family)